MDLVLWRRLNRGSGKDKLVELLKVEVDDATEEDDQLLLLVL